MKNYKSHKGVFWDDFDVFDLDDFKSKRDLTIGTYIGTFWVFKGEIMTCIQKPDPRNDLDPNEYWGNWLFIGFKW